MDDGKCLLDVISDPQALKEFFRSPSQIGFVDCDISPVKPTLNEDTINTDEQKQDNNDIQSVVRNDAATYISNSQSTSHRQPAPTTSTGVLQQTQPLVHFSYPTSSGLNLNAAPFTSSLPLQNGQMGGNVGAAQARYVASSDVGSRAANRGLIQTKSVQKHAVSAAHKLPMNMPSVSKEQAGKTFANTPLPFAFGDAGKARTILSSGGVSSLDKTTTSSHGHLKSGHAAAQLKQPLSKMVVVPASGPSIRTGTSKASPLAPLRPKKIVPRPAAQQNPVPGDHGNIISQGKVVNAGGIKGPLIAIQPKLIIGSQPNATISSASIANQGGLGSGIGSKLSLPNQTLNTLLLQQQKTGGQNGSQMSQNKASANNLVQLQPKQIAPKPGQAAGYVGKQAMSQEHIQQQLVQSLLAKTQQNQSQQFVLSPASSSGQDDKQGNSIEKQQNQLKELLQRNQLIQQVIQVQRLQQQQQQNASSAIGSQVGMMAGGGQQLEKNAVTGQNSPLLMNSALAQQQKAQLTLGQSSGANNLSSGTISAKQLQQFLEKNPLVAQQLKQINLKQGGGVTRNLSGPTATVSVAKSIARPQVVAQPQQPSSIATPAAPKKMAVAAAQPQAVCTVTDQKVAGAQKVLLVQQSGSAPVGQPRVLLQTKEGRPILLTQEQFKQIQQQLASKNLTIQAKLVTTTSTAPQVVVKSSNAINTKPISKVATTTSHVKQEISKGLKRAAKPVETEESKLIKRMKGAVMKDQNDVSFIDIHPPFKSHEEAVKKLLPFHVFSEPQSNARMQRRANNLLDKLALQLTKKSDRMIHKYRQLLFGDMQREVPSAELVMVNRIFLADEKAALMNEKKMVLEEARKMTHSLASGSSASAVVKQEAQIDLTAMSPGDEEDDANMLLNSNERALDFLLNTTPSSPGEDGSPIMSESQQHIIDIMDDDDSPSPITSASNFLTHISTQQSTLNNQRTSNYTPEPS